MASQDPNNPSNARQGQIWRDDMLNQQSNTQNQDQSTNFLQETGTQVKNIAQGAADVGKGAVQGAVSIARGTALGAANIAQGAADAVKNTIGPDNTNATTNTNTNTTSGRPGTTTAASLGGGNYPSSNHPSNPNTSV
ncbi:uncharacterized protein Fot_08620 [Forsythia ovata]|uniref:Uncharacterized protein n=1 Tax=Forsythia ovata TaxID=205694 RepID=A0ABD1WZ51_9LAMI